MQRDAKGILIGPSVGARPFAQLRGHVGRRPRHRSVGRVQVVCAVREPEVGDAHAPARAHEHVGRLEVAVDEPSLVRGREPAPRGDEGLDHGALAQAAAPQPRGERLPFDELHREEDPTAVGAELVDRHDVRMGQARQRLRLPDEAVARVFVRGRPQELEGNLASEAGVVGAIDDPHRAGTERLEDDIASEHGPGGERRGRLQRTAPLDRARYPSRVRHERAASRALVEVVGDLGRALRVDETLEELEDRVLVQAFHARDPPRERTFAGRRALT